MANDAYVFSLPLLPGVTVQNLLYGSLAVALVAILIGVFFARSRKSSKGRIVLLVGDEDAGKTTILSTLIYEHALPTHTSLQLNSIFLPSTTSQKKALEVVDVPGHPRLRGSFKTYVPEAKAIVFVVDASTVTRRGAQVAEHMHNVLDAITSLPPSQRLPPLLIIAHKADLLSSSSAQSPAERTALAISRVRTVLERELEKRRSAAAGGVGVEGLGAEGEGTELGRLDCRTPGGSFRFAEWEGGEVEFIGTWAKVSSGLAEKTNVEKVVNGADGLDGFRIWLDELR